MTLPLGQGRGSGHGQPPEAVAVQRSLLLCALLRATGTPARLRAGYGTYFVEGFHDDHWVTEYRAADGSWRLADAQVSTGLYDVPFDPLDVPRDRFVVAGQAWRACRTGLSPFLGLRKVTLPRR
ncbi:hypothetical protein ACFV2H_26200 [Streptomyces sp. NPDC059629]|uniref:hypothetical protein n=1 Tax=Streptomyces sp. NPDC059629 TaxID=3346889 RepID=UPI0036CF4342